MATTTAVNFGSLVGAQLSALIEAEVEGAEKTSEFIENVGFERQKDGSLRLRMVSFDMVRRDVDGVARKHTISVPVLTLVPIPLLSIREADMEFDLYVESVETVATKAASKETPQTGHPADPMPTPAPIGPQPEPTGPQSTPSFLAKSAFSEPAPPSVRLVTRFAKTKHENTKTSSDLKIKVKIEQSPFPLGIERLLNTADLSVEDETNE